MSDLIKPTGDVTMSSREIAELVEKRHDNVKRTIETLIERGVIGVPQIEEYRDTLKRPARAYRVGKRDSYVIVAQLSPEFTARLVDRWQELEARTAQPAINLADPNVLRSALLQYTERVIQLEHTVAEQAPKVEALDRIASAEGSLCVRDASKALQLRPTDLTRWLQAHQWVYRRVGHAPLIAYQDKIQLGLLEHKVTTVTRTDGSDKVVEQVRITPKGLARLAVDIQRDIALAA
ncbi:phage antirepressor KilAC domain-containing protein [Paraburkholderia bannensis]|uniref:phage antirepressor KilAC domain-containing protein n=1 Tax=Paraburkholderia bannensis TaxID=765414 RepID=UPI002ABE990F|nr:phage antirepressor KilAC domain-containing protein [Paraburkholderia bannensis]